MWSDPARREQSISTRDQSALDGKESRITAQKSTGANAAFAQYFHGLPRKCSISSFPQGVIDARQRQS
jgi:hypothetical protein